MSHFVILGSTGVNATSESYSFCVQLMADPPKLPTNLFLDRDGQMSGNHRSWYWDELVLFGDKSGVDQQLRFPFNVRDNWKVLIQGVF